MDDGTKKKVLFVATVDSHILQFHLPYLKMFKEKKYEVHVATNGTEEIPYCDVKHVISFERKPIKINNLKAIRQMKKLVNEEKFDIIHCHTPMGAAITRISARRIRKKGTRVIYTAHGFHFYKGAPVLNWIIYYPIEKLLSRYTDCLITINQEDYDLAKKKFKTPKIELIDGIGVDENKFNFVMSEREKEELRNKIGISKEDFVLIYTAELSKRKNQKMLIEIMKILIEDSKEYKLILPGLDSMRGECQKIVKKYGLEDNIKFLGYRTDITRLLRISNLAVSTSKQEGLPVNIIEALISGLPVIATNCRGNRDLIEDGKNGYIVEINDIEEFANKVKEIKESKSKFVNSKIERYYFNEIKDKYMAIYNEGNNLI